MSAAERLKKVREILGKGQKEMAESMGINYRTYQNYENALSDPSWSACESLVKLGFNANWLLTGEGEMRRGTAASPGADHSGDVTAMIAADPAAPFAQDAESEELCRLLKRYGNRALIEDFKTKLMKMKAVVEG